MTDPRYGSQHSLVTAHGTVNVTPWFPSARVLIPPAKCYTFRMIANHSRLSYRSATAPMPKPSAKARHLERIASIRHPGRSRGGIGRDMTRCPPVFIGERLTVRESTRPAAIVLSRTVTGGTLL